MRNGGDLRVPQMDTGVLREAFDLAARATSAAEARRRSFDWLVKHAVVQQAAETAVLIVSEFVANAVVHTGSTVISCALNLHGSLLRVEVTDQGSSAVCEAWGAVPAVPGGWTVWATVRTTASSAVDQPRMLVEEL